MHVLERIPPIQCADRERPAGPLLRGVMRYPASSRTWKISLAMRRTSWSAPDVIAGRCSGWSELALRFNTLALSGHECRCCLAVGGRVCFVHAGDDDDAGEGCERGDGVDGGLDGDEVGEESGEEGADGESGVSPEPIDAH